MGLATLQHVVSSPTRDQSVSPALVGRFFIPGENARSWEALGDPDEALGGGNQGPSAPGWARQHHSRRDPPFVPSKRRGLQETRVATREESGVLGFPSRRGLTPRGSLECNPEIPAFPGVNSGSW